MKENKKISIITVCFNSEKTIEDTIKSVLYQNYSNLEYIIIDGLSKDNTMKIVNSYINEFKHRGIDFKIISEKDSGIYEAMNKGISIANGEIIGIINSDDWYENNIISEVENVFEEFNVDIVYGDLSWVLEFDGCIYEKNRKSCSSFNEVKKGMVINHPTVFVKNEIYNKIGKFNEKYKIAADWDFMLRAMSYGVNTYYLKKKIANFRFNGVSTMPNFGHVMEKVKVRLNNKISWYKIIESFIKDFIGNIIMVISRSLIPKSIYLKFKKKQLEKQWRKIK